MIGAGYLCQYKKNNYEKKLPYECGVNLFSDARAKFDMRYLNYAYLFLIFDVEAVFLFPLAVTLNEMPFYVLGESVVFILIFLFALIYSIKKNILRWQ